MHRVIVSYLQGVMEVYAAPQHIDCNDYNNFRSISVMFLIASGIFAFLALVLSSVFATIWTILTLTAALFLRFARHSFRTTRRRNRARFSRFFSMFSRIETVVLDNFQNSQGNVNAVKETLKEVQIDRLEIKTNCLGDYLQYAYLTHNTCKRLLQRRNNRPMHESQRV